MKSEWIKVQCLSKGIKRRSKTNRMLKREKEKKFMIFYLVLNHFGQITQNPMQGQGVKNLKTRVATIIQFSYNFFFFHLVLFFNHIESFKSHLCSVQLSLESLLFMIIMMMLLLFAWKSSPGKGK